MAVVLALAAVWLEVSFLAPLRPLGVVPNLALVVMVLVATSVAASTGLALAAVVGLSLDLVSGRNFGLETGFFLLLLLSISLLERLGTDFNNLGLLAGVVAAGTLVVDGAILVSLALGGGGVRWGYAAHTVVLELICNLALLVALRAALAGLLRPPRDALSIGPRRG